MEETDDAFDERLCRVIAQAETTFFAESYVWKPLGSGKAPSTNVLACVADGDVWHEFVPAADANGGFRVVLFKFSESGPSAIGFVAWHHSHLRRTGKNRSDRHLRQGSTRVAETVRDLPGRDGLLGLSRRSGRGSLLDVIRTLVKRGAALT